MYGQTCLKVGTKASWAPSFREALGLVPRCSLSFGLLKTPHHFASAHNAVSTTIYLGALQIASQTLSTRRLWGVHPQLPWLRAGAVERSMGEEGKSLGTPRPSKYESLRPSSSLPRPLGLLRSNPYRHKAPSWKARPTVASPSPRVLKCNLAHRTEN